MKQTTTPATQYFVKATVTYKDSSRRKGGYFSYTDVELSNCLVVINGTMANIYHTPHYHGIATDCKRTTGKYFNFSGKKVTKKTFDKYYAVLDQQHKDFKASYDAKQAAQTAAYAAEKEAKEAAINEEVEMIKIDQRWIDEKKAACQLEGLAKNDAFIAAMKGLLSRNGIEKLQYFYQVMKKL